MHENDTMLSCIIMLMGLYITLVMMSQTSVGSSSIIARYFLSGCCFLSFWARFRSSTGP
jgi:hypothetical protein